MDKKAYRALNNTFSLQSRITLIVVEILDTRHTHDFSAAISVDRLQALGEYVKDNEAKIRTAFGVRFRRSTGGATDSRRYVVEVMNQMLRQWGYSKLQRRARKRKRTGDEQVDESVYGMERHASQTVDVYEHIHPKARRHKQPCTS